MSYTAQEVEDAFAERTPELELKPPAPAMLIDEARHDCQTCRDSGWRRIEDGSEYRFTRCECQLPANNPRLVRRSLAGAGMKAEEIESAFGTWDTGHQPKPTFARKWLADALSGVTDSANNHWCLTLLGEPGRGKTKTAAVLMRLFIKAGGTNALWVRVPEGFDQVQAERMSGAYLEEGALEKRIAEADLVVFDDFGITHRSDGDLVEATVNEWLARRHRRHGLSVITANALELDQLGAPRIESRIADGVYRVMEASTDYRDRET